MTVAHFPIVVRPVVHANVAQNQIGLSKMSTKWLHSQRTI